MNQTLIYLLWLIAFMACKVCTSHGQSPEALFNLAIEANQELQAMKLDYQAAVEKAPQVSQLPNPEIGIGAFILPVETRLGPQQARLSVSQSFPWFGTLRAQENWATKQARAKFERIAATELEIKFRLETAYYALYELHASEKIIQQNLVFFESLKALALSKVSAGQSSLTDVLSIDLRTENLSQQLRLLENRKRKPRASINQLLFRDLTNSILIPNRLSFADQAVDKDSLLKQIERSHPLLRMYSLQQEAANAALAVNERQSKPSFGIGADYIHTGQRLDAFPDKNGRDAFLLRAGISIPLYRGKYQAKAREEQIRIQAFDAQKQETLSQFEAVIETAFADYEEARLNLSFYDQQIKTSKAAIEILESEYSSQASSFDELLQMEIALLKYELGKLRAIVQSHLTQARINRYLPY